MNELKYVTFLTFLARGWVDVHFNPKARGVVVPGRLLERDLQIFQYGKEMPTPIPDLDLRPDGISATLSFGRMPFLTFVPWHAVSLICQHEGGAILMTDLEAAPAPGPKSTKRRRPRVMEERAPSNGVGKPTLRVIEGGRK